MASGLPVPGLVIHSLPADLEDYAQQIAGHGTEVVERSSEKFLKGKDGSIYKPLQPPPKGWKEVSFYEDMFSKARDDDAVYQQFRRWIPGYHGIFQRSSGAGNHYIKLEDALGELGKPLAMMDIKIGQRTYEPTASEKKVREEQGKYAWRNETGFLICGMRTLEASGEYKFYDRLHWRSIPPQRIVQDALHVFLRTGQQSSERVLQLASCLRDRLVEIEKLFVQQRAYHFYSSSLLFAYDEASAVVKMIDFAHALRCGEEDSDTIDENYLFGLRQVIAYFDQVLSAHHN